MIIVEVDNDDNGVKNVGDDDDDDDDDGDEISDEG